MKKQTQGTVFFGAARRLIIDRGVKGKAGNSRKMMFNKGSRPIPLEELQQHWFRRALDGIAAKLLLKRSL